MAAALILAMALQGDAAVHGAGSGEAPKDAIRGIRKDRLIAYQQAARRSQEATQSGGLPTPDDARYAALAVVAITAGDVRYVTRLHPLAALHLLAQHWTQEAVAASDRVLHEFNAMGPEAQYRPGDPELLDNYCRAAIAADRLRDLPSIVALGVPEDVATPGLAAASRIVARFNTLGPTAKVDPSDFEVLRKLDLILDRVEPNH